MDKALNSAAPSHSRKSAVLFLSEWFRCQRLGRTEGASLLSLQNTKIPIFFPLPSKKIRKKILQTENNAYFR
jgi:hypothetical protein